MPVAAIPRYVQVATSIGAGQPLASVGVIVGDHELLIAISSSQVGLEPEDPDEARILPASRYVETNSPVMQQELLDTGMFQEAEAP